MISLVGWAADALAGAVVRFEEGGPLGHELGAKDSDLLSLRDRVPVPVPNEFAVALRSR